MTTARQGKQTKRVEHWTISEEMHYHFFLVLKYRKFAESKSKNQKIFKDMEVFLGKESTKCRSHHQKRMKNIKGIKGISDLIRGFYHNFYEIRCLGLKHCIRQFKDYLQEKQPPEGRQANSELDSLVQQFKINLDNILQEPPHIIAQPQSTQSHSQKQDSKQLRMRRLETEQTLHHHYLLKNLQDDASQ